MPGCRAGPWLSFFPDPSPHGPFLPQLRLPVPTTRIMEIAILFALILLNGVFAMSEIALVTADRKSTRLNSSHLVISYAVFCLKKKKKTQHTTHLTDPTLTLLT